jgi:hypothetical protein
MTLTIQTALRKDTTTKAAMQHRHFATIAQIINNRFGTMSPTSLNIVAEAFADELADTNPRFDRERFLRACRGY